MEIEMNWREFAEKAITVPFVEHGRTWDGFDCYGLVVLGYREVLGVDIPSYDTEYATTDDLRTLQRVFLRERTAKWAEGQREIGKVAMITRRNSAVHVGLVITSRDILHCEKAVGTVINQDRELQISGFWKPAWI